MGIDAPERVDHNLTLHGLDRIHNDGHRALGVGAHTVKDEHAVHGWTLAGV